jgi:3D (Asp-Asp-Asp) domain-containing protein
MPRTLLILTTAMLTAVPAAGEPGGAVRMRATAYCQTGKTSSGVTVKEGVVAADPRVLAQGTVIQIESPLPRYSGLYTVQDTGAAVKGKIIDIFIANCREAKRFGRRRVKVHIVAPEPSDTTVATK